MKLVSCPKCDGVKRFVESGTGKHFCEECGVELNRSYQTEQAEASSLSDLLCPKRYGSVSCGVDEHKNGNLLMVPDVVKALEEVLDDESQIMERIDIILCHLRA